MFEDRLKKLRENNGWTQKEVAEILKINPRTYSSYENNEREPNSEILLSLADTFNVSIDYLIGYDQTRIMKGEIGRKEEKQLTKSELKLIDDYRELSYQGKEYIQKTLEICKAYFLKEDTPPILHNKDAHLAWEAARSADNTPPGMTEISQEDFDALLNAPAVTSDEDL